MNSLELLLKAYESWKDSTRPPPEVARNLLILLLSIFARLQTARNLSIKQTQS
jgi:hypothetical protein